MDEFERRDVFHKAADLLEKEGWIKGHMTDGQSHCMVGALRVVTKGTPGNNDDFETNESYGGIEVDVMMDWNDASDRRVEDVVQRLRAMAAGKHTKFVPEDWFDCDG